MPVPVPRRSYNWGPDGRVEPIAGYLPPWYNKPGQLHQEAMVSDSMRIAQLSPAEVQQVAPPRSPAVMVPPRHGYAKREWTIEDVLSLSRRPLQRNWATGPPPLGTGAHPGRTMEPESSNAGFRNVYNPSAW